MNDLTDDQVRALLSRHDRFMAGDDVPILCANEAADLARALLEARAECDGAHMIIATERAEVVRLRAENARLRADADAAMAMVVEKAAETATEWAEQTFDGDPVGVGEYIVDSLADADGLAMVEALRKERDEYKRLAIAGNLIALEMRIVEGDRDRLAADLAAAQAQNEALRTVAAAYEAWEADVIMAADWTHATPRMTQNQWDELVRIQGLRNAALTKPEGE